MSKFMNSDKKFEKLHENVKDCMKKIKKQDEDNLKFLQTLKTKRLEPTKVSSPKDDVEEEDNDNDEDDNLKDLNSKIETCLRNINECSKDSVKEREHILDSVRWAELDHMKNIDKMSYYVQKTIDKKRSAKNMNLKKIESLQASFNQLHEKTLSMITNIDTMRGLKSPKLLKE